jgi:hypothetical protein
MSEEETPSEAPVEAPPEAPVEASADNQTVPYERFASKIAEIKNLEEQLAVASKTVEETKHWEQKATELQSTYDEASKVWEKEEALYQAGISNPEIRELAQWRFEKSGVEGDFGDWLKGEGKEDPLLKSHLVEKEGQRAKISSPNIGIKETPPARGEYSPEAVQGMSVEEVKKNYARIAGAWGYRAHEFK